jgi:hypothetical protein
MSNTNLVFVYKGNAKQKIHIVDLPAWKNAGWSTNPAVNNQINEQKKPSKARSKSAKNAVQEQIEKGEIE